MAVVLIAEDDADVGMVLQRTLRRAGFTVLTAPDGVIALQTAVGQRPDVILTDLDMPGLTGLELAQALREHPGEHDVPIMILSGSLLPGDPRCAEARLCEVMLKPFVGSELVTAVRRLAATGRHRHDAEPSPCPLQQRLAPQRGEGLLEKRVIELAETPGNAAGIDDRLAAIAQLAVDRVRGVDYASVTALRSGAYTTVEANSAVARAVDEAQYADRAGPCVQAVDEGTAVVVPDVTATMMWPGFRDAALGMGLHASVTVPLIAGGGAPVAVLNLHGRDADAMAILIAAVVRLYRPDRRLPAGHDRLPPLDSGGEELMTGLTAALHRHLPHAAGTMHKS